METASALAKAQGARRVIPLAVTIASHSPLMKEAAAVFAQAVAGVAIRQSRVPVIANVTGRPLTSAPEIRNEMIAQLTSPVRWTASVQYMIAQGVSSFAEIGPKDVLTGLIKRIDAAATATSVSDAASVTRFVVHSARARRQAAAQCLRGHGPGRLTVGLQTSFHGGTTGDVRQAHRGGSSCLT
jgi:[acyl-carrier-protein] S-malonyltransferase